jgi:site-specific DNA recombinase
MIEKTYNVGIYCRLSNDDERDGESVSIENQKLLLQSYVRQRGWNEIAVYCDAAVIIGLKTIRLKKFQKHGAF